MKGDRADFEGMMLVFVNGVGALRPIDHIAEETFDGSPVPIRYPVPVIHAHETWLRDMHGNFYIFRIK